jgi:hypothetical protein
MVSLSDLEIFPRSALKIGSLNIEIRNKQEPKFKIRNGSG